MDGDKWRKVCFPAISFNGFSNKDSQIVVGSHQMFIGLRHWFKYTHEYNYLKENNQIISKIFARYFVIEKTKSMQIERNEGRKKKDQRLRRLG